MNKSLSTTTVIPSLLLIALPLALLLKILLLLFAFDSLSVKGYVVIQKEWFYFINHQLNHHQLLLLNLTQLGDALIFLSFLTLLLIYFPKIWEALITGSLISMLLAVSLKGFFSVPRPAKAFNYTTFMIIGEKLTGSTSLPSGHSITIFTIITVLVFAFVPRNKNYQVIYFTCSLGLGLLFAFTRVAVGAHYPLDVIVGSLLGFISGLLGIYITHKCALWPWLHHKKYYPLFIVIFLFCCAFLIVKILNDNLFIYYCALTSLFYTLYKITKCYVQK